MSQLCTYGCGKQALFFFKNGRGCCENSFNRCPQTRKNNILKKAGVFTGTPSWAVEGYVHSAWNKGQTYESMYGQNSEQVKEKIRKTIKGKSTGKAKTPEKELERKFKISSAMKNNPRGGGLRKGSGRGKKGSYQGYWCDSSWELAWVIYNLEHDIVFTRNQEGFSYVFEGTSSLYYPDFIIEGQYYEIKGRRDWNGLDKKSKEKIRQFTGKLSVLYTTDMQPYLEYAVRRYGKDFVRLYDCPK
jgi:hypothetical protein